MKGDYTDWKRRLHGLEKKITQIRKNDYTDGNLDGRRTVD
jgi:hypothetical protein